jgi:tetratricopeptide (TPR) repeat protein
MAWEEAWRSFPDSYDRFFLQLRVATTELKRFGQPSRAANAVEAAKREAANLMGDGHTLGDQEFAGALLSNFAALISLSREDMDGAKNRVERAWNVMREVPSNSLTLEPPLANRYRIMVLENRGLLSARQGEWAAAEAIFSEAVVLARLEEPTSLSEALSLSAYAQLRRRRITDARRSLEEAVTLLAADTRPATYAATCRMLAVACDRLEDSKGAAAWLGRADDHRLAWRNEPAAGFAVAG